jgi:hypothetical protein
MNQKKNSLLSLRIIVALLAMLLQSGCMMALATLKGEPGKDVSSIKPGISKQDAEEILGSPMREWTTPLTIHYCVYSYDAGIPPSVAGAAVLASFGIISAGLYDLYDATGLINTSKLKEGDRVIEKIAISYDANDTIVGVFHRFGDFDALPEDGRAEK